MSKIQVDMYAVRWRGVTPRGESEDRQAVPLHPVPFDSVDGRHGSDKVRDKVLKTMRDLGYANVSVNWTENGLLVYVDADKTPTKPMRSARSRL